MAAAIIEKFPRTKAVDLAKLEAEVTEAPPIKAATPTFERLLFLEIVEGFRVRCLL